MSRYHRVTFIAEMSLADEEIDSANSNLEQAVQNAIGESGAVVNEVTAHVPPRQRRTIIERPDAS